MPRDSQKTKFYNTEHAVFDGTIDFETIREAQQFANKVTRSKVWKKIGGRSFVQVKPVPARRYARGWYNIMELPPWAMQKPVVIHELCHSLAQSVRLDGEHHGPGFTFLFRKLIEQEFGDETRRQFDLAGERRGLKWNPDSRILKRLA